MGNYTTQSFIRLIHKYIIIQLNYFQSSFSFPQDPQSEEDWLCRLATTLMPYQQDKYTEVLIDLFHQTVIL